MGDIIDINVQVAIDEVTINATPNNYIINVNRIIGEQVQSDWNVIDDEAPDYIKNKPTIPSIDGLATVIYVDQQDALKVDKITGKGLSTNDFTDTLKTKLDGIQEGAEVNVNADWNAVSGDAEILNKPTIPVQFTKTSDLINDGEDGINPFITSADIIPQVNSDWNATSGVAEILNKPTIPSIDGLATVIYVDQQDALKVDKVVGSRLITSAEATILSNTSGVNTGDQDLSGKVDKITGYSLTKNDFTDTLKTKLDGIAAGAEVNVNADWNAVSGDAEILNKPSIPAAQIQSDWTQTNNVALDYIKNKPTIPAAVTKTSDLINDGDDGNPFISLEDLPSNLTLYATNAASDVATYYKLVTSITDPSFNTTAVNIPTGAITTTNQFISSLITTPNVIAGNPGVFNITTIGNIQRLSGTGNAEFYFEVWKRVVAGTETLITTSNNTLPVLNSGYAEFSATALWNDGVFLSTDRIVLKYYASRVAGGSNPSYQFQFGGISPVRSLVPIPLNVVPVIKLDDLQDVTITSVANNEILTWEAASNLWKNKTVVSALGFTPYNATNPNGYTSNLGTVTSVAALTLGTTGTDLSSTVANGTTTPVITLNVPTASATNRGALSSANWTTFNGKQNALNGTGFVKISGTTISYDNSTYQPLLTNPITGIGTTNYLPKFTGASALGNSLIYDNGTNVGIGTSSPGTKLQVAGTITSINGSNGRFNIGSLTNYLYGDSSSNIILGNSGGDRLIINSIGNVGIGTSSPTDFGGGYTNLDVFGTNAMVISRNSSGLFGQMNAAGNDALYLGTRSNHNVNLTANNSNVMTLTAGGNVGIGTTSPNINNYTRALTVLASSGYAGIEVYGGSTTVGAQIDFGGGTDRFASISGEYESATNGYLNIRTRRAGSMENAMRITSAGNVGIGTTSPTAKLHVVGMVEYATNALAIAGGLTVGAFYHTAGVVKVVI